MRRLLDGPRRLLAVPRGAISVPSAPSSATRGVVMSEAEKYARTSLGSNAAAAAAMSSFRASDHGVSSVSTARSPLNRSVWDSISSLETFDGNAKQQWIDERRGWCHLCGEAMGTSLGVHISDRDHVCLGYFAYLIALYPRDWGFQAVLDASAGTRLQRHAVSEPWSQDHLHCTSDCARRAELQALLIQLAAPPHNALHYSFSGRAPSSFWYSGERMFKVQLSRLVTIMYPAMAPGVHTQFTHKCWGRSNLERMYDALHIADIKADLFGVEGKTTRDARAYWMRLLFWDAMTALDNRDLPAVTQVLLEEALRRLAFEATFHMSMYYMNRAQNVWSTLGCEPSVQLLQQLNSV